MHRWRENNSSGKARKYAQRGSENLEFRQFQAEHFNQTLHVSRLISWKILCNQFKIIFFRNRNELCNKHLVHPANILSVCRQSYVTLSLKTLNKNDEIINDEFRIPSYCSCQLVTRKKSGLIPHKTFNLIDDNKVEWNTLIQRGILCIFLVALSTTTKSSQLLQLRIYLRNLRNKILSSSLLILSKVVSFSMSGYRASPSVSDKSSEWSRLNVKMFRKFMSFVLLLLFAVRAWIQFASICSLLFR